MTRAEGAIKILIKEAKERKEKAIEEENYSYAAEQEAFKNGLEMALAIMESLKD